jgi:hypothetical protein
LGNPPAVTERVLLKEQFVQVTTRRLMLGSKRTYVVNHIVSVETAIKAADKSGPFAVAVIGVLLMVGAAIAGGNSAPVLMVIGLSLLLVAAALAAWMRPEPLVRFSLSSGERIQVTDHDEEFIKRVAAAAVAAVTQSG